MGSQACNPSAYEDRRRNILVPDGLGFHSEFQAKQGYIVRASRKEKKAKTKPQNKKYSCKVWQRVAHAYNPNTQEVETGES